jgi:glucose-6-phosphate-specific signal transduction histidine kinase
MNRNDELGLEIGDDGVGFDIESARLAVGLISMRERIHLIGGQFEIWSSPGAEHEGHGSCTHPCKKVTSQPQASV